ncbi:hypothetical protein [Arthrobacter sp. M4]|uniref:transmembrane-type terpene cyclase n=1 Tax=Arthrobacter sp. M4 TaxID=218160 RepID=UPI001CDCB838|nr:hypothetical protein [Arthrobacter sp. M4]MCA4134913.1 hypothetical protein [Arthrobacter sp. M4]
MSLFLTLLSGIAWSVVYVESIRVGFRDRSYAIPAAALALNIAWEILYTGYGFSHGTDVQTVVNFIWGLADLVIVYTFLRFGRSELPAFIGRGLFAGWATLLLVMAALVQWFFVVQFDWHDAARYAAFLQNLLMSGLFIAMLVARRGPRGQSLVIAFAKWIGTLAPTILFGVMEGSPLVLVLGTLCTVFDLTYIALLWRWRAGVPSLEPRKVAVG